MAQEEAFGAAQAEALLGAGWGQGAVFSPNEHVPMPHGDAARGLLVVCTQSCGVVSPSLERDPHVELMIAYPVAKYAPRSTEATGKHGRTFHLPVDGADFEAVSVDVNSRFFVGRQALLRFVPDGARPKPGAVRDLAGWVGRHYTRIALPNELVRRLEPTLFKLLKKHLSEAARPAAGGVPALRVHEAIGAIFVRWTPDIELDADRSYEVAVLAVSDDAGVADELDRRLSSLGGDAGGVAYEITVQARGETVLTNLDGYVRLTEYDYLTGMAKAAELPG